MKNSHKQYHLESWSTLMCHYYRVPCILIWNEKSYLWENAVLSMNLEIGKMPVRKQVKLSDKHWILGRHFFLDCMLHWTFVADQPFFMNDSNLVLNFSFECMANRNHSKFIFKPTRFVSNTVSYVRVSKCKFRNKLSWSSCMNWLENMFGVNLGEKKEISTCLAPFAFCSFYWLPVLIIYNM